MGQALCKVLSMHEDGMKGTEGQRGCLEEKGRRRGKVRGGSWQGIVVGDMCTHKEDVPLSVAEASVGEAASSEAQIPAAVARSRAAHVLGSESLVPVVRAGLRDVC